jgi:purine-cytosine permease-like protein
VWTIGIIGTVLGLISPLWLTRFAELMTWLGAILVPVGGVFLAHFVIMRKRVDVDAVYRVTALPSFSIAGMSAWAAGFAVYKLAAPVGATLPALATSIIVYMAIRKRPSASTTPSD